MKFSRILFITMVLIVISCTAEEVTTGAPEIVAGTVALYDEFGNQLDLVDSVSMFITHDGGVTYETTTMEDGDYRFEIKRDWTRFWVSRPAFGTREILDLDTDYLNGRTIRLSQQSSMEIRDLTVVKGDCGALPCVDLSFQVDNYLIDQDEKRFFELEMNNNEVTLGKVRFFAFQSSEPGMVVTPLEGSSVKLALEALPVTGLENVFGQEVSFRVYGATPNSFHQDFTIEEADNSRNHVFGEFTLAS